MKLSYLTQAVTATLALVGAAHAASTAPKLVARDGKNAAPNKAPGVPADVVIGLTTTANATSAPNLSAPSQLMTFVLGVQPPQGPVFNQKLVTALAQKAGPYITGGANNISFNCGTDGSAMCADLNPDPSFVASNVIQTATANNITVTLQQVPGYDANNLVERAFHDNLQSALDGTLGKRKPIFTKDGIPGYAISGAAGFVAASMLALTLRLCCGKRSKSSVKDQEPTLPAVQFNQHFAAPQYENQAPQLNYPQASYYRGY